MYALRTARGVPRVRARTWSEQGQAGQGAVVGEPGGDVVLVEGGVGLVQRVAHGRRDFRGEGGEVLWVVAAWAT